MTARITMTDCFLIVIAFGAVAGGAYGLGAQARAPMAAPVLVVKTEYLTQQVWSPACSSNVAGKSVREAGVRALEAHVATAEWGTGERTYGAASGVPGKRVHRTPYEKARDAAERRHYRDMFRTLERRAEWKWRQGVVSPRHSRTWGRRVRLVRLVRIFLGGLLAPFQF